VLPLGWGKDSQPQKVVSQLSLLSPGPVWNLIPEGGPYLGLDVMLLENDTPGDMEISTPAGGSNTLVDETGTGWSVSLASVGGTVESNAPNI